MASGGRCMSCAASLAARFICMWYTKGPEAVCVLWLAQVTRGEAHKITQETVTAP